MPNALTIRDLNIYDRAGAHLVRTLTLTLAQGETLALVGESGSGKTLTLKSIMGLLPDGVRKEVSVMQAEPRRAMVFQDPLRALDPIRSVSGQLEEVIMCRQGLSRSAARAEAGRLIRRLGLPQELTARGRLPHELSGGQCQRIMIAMALSCRPKLLLCDEPTTALDVTVQKETLDLIGALRREEGFSMVFVTHNLAVAAAMCGRIAVMRRGQIVEEGLTEDVLTSPKDAYTKALLSAVPEV